MATPGDEPIEWDDSEPTFADINHWQEVEITVKEGFVFHGFKPSERKHSAAWECPRCQRINAPHSERCDCGPEGES